MVNIDSSTFVRQVLFPNPPELQKITNVVVLLLRLLLLERVCDIVDLRICGIANCEFFFNPSKHDIVDVRIFF